MNWVAITHIDEQVKDGARPKLKSVRLLVGSMGPWRVSTLEVERVRGEQETEVQV